MANIFKQKFGISIGLFPEDRMGVFMENGVNYMEFRFDKTPDLDFGRNFVKKRHKKITRKEAGTRQQKRTKQTIKRGQKTKKINRKKRKILS